MDSAALLKNKLNPELIRLVRYCQKLQRGKALPDWQDFSPTALPFLMGHMFAADVVDGGADFRYRSYGALMPEFFGFDMRGKLLSNAPDANFRVAIKQTYEQVLAEKRPIAHWIELSWPDGGRYALQYVLIPFGSADGKVATILGGVDTKVAREDLAGYRGSGIATFHEIRREIL